MIFALIKNGVVINTIVADQAFADSIASQYDAVIQVGTDPGHPSIGWTYSNGSFSPPASVATPALDPLSQEKANAAFAKDLMASFAVMNNQRDLSVSQRVQLATILAPLQSILTVGDLATALAVLESLTPDGVLLTQDIINTFSTQIASYLAAI